MGSLDDNKIVASSANVVVKIFSATENQSENCIAYWS